jgi:hypothetical protein
MRVHSAGPAVAPAKLPPAPPDALLLPSVRLAMLGASALIGLVTVEFELVVPVAEVVMGRGASGTRSFRRHTIAASTTSSKAFGLVRIAREVATAANTSDDDDELCASPCDNDDAALVV